MEPRPKPAGFGNCGRCPYLSQGTPEICFTCASSSFERLAEHRCALCERALQDDGSCANPLCNWPESDRFFRWVWAISMRTGPLRRAIDLYKVEGRRGWAAIFGRILVGYLNAHRSTFSKYDLIIPSPTFVGTGGRAFDHTGLVIERAALEDEDDAWPFSTTVLVKTAATTPFRGTTWKRRHAIAKGEIRSALAVAEEDRVRHKRILVYDDVYTEGLTLREVARALGAAGAAEVSELVLARQPYAGV